MDLGDFGKLQVVEVDFCLVIISCYRLAEHQEMEVSELESVPSHRVSKHRLVLRKHLMLSQGCQCKGWT